MNVKNPNTHIIGTIMSFSMFVITQLNPVKFGGEILIFHKERYMQVSSINGKQENMLTTPTNLDNKLYCAKKDYC